MVDVLELLQEKNIIDASTYEKLAVEVEGGDAPLHSILEKHGVDKDTLLKVLGEHYKLPTHQLSEYDKIEPSVLKYLPEESARHYRLLPLAKKDGVMEVGIVDPDELTALDALNFIAAKNDIPYKLVLILPPDFDRGIAMYENLTGEVGEALTELESELTAEIDAKQKEEVKKKEGGGEYIKEDAPVTKIVATILRYAVDGNASDIHIEPVADKVRVRFRIDGVLTTSLELPSKVRAAAVARVKILSSMRLDEKRKPQDGRFSATIDGKKIDFRVSTLPTHFGEKVVMRILDPDSGVRTLEGTGISPYNLKLIRKAIKKPYGIVLISGPTGSGKSTTLYGLLQEVDRVGRNVLSLEDPIEYNIEGISQSQVRPEIGYTFASGLRSVLRQDPDIIMVGEIRDKETAQLAIQAALTGHLVLSTIHTNNAIGVAPRLIDMGVDPYLIAPTLVLAVAQRLVRRICPNSGIEVPVEGSLKMMIEHEFNDLPPEFRDRIPKSNSVLNAESTPECPNGTRGRTAVVEAIEVTPNIETLILNSASEDEIYKAVRKEGFIDMKGDAITKALRHEIPFEEVNQLGGALTFFEEDAKTETNVSEGETPEAVDKPNTGDVANNV